MKYERKNVGSMREESMENTIELLAKLSGVAARQIYNYRMGKTQIPDNLILLFCREFRSTAMVAAWLREQNTLDELENFEIVQLANRSARQTLQAHDRFLEAFGDGVIDGFELSELKSQTAASMACFQKLEQVAEDAYQRRRCVA